MKVPKKIRVLVIDDSALVRQLVTDALHRDPEIEVVGTAIDPYVAREKILKLRPDVLTLDIELPRMDGLRFLKILMDQYPLPVIILSSLTPTGSSKALEALESGAIDVIGKPSSPFSIGELGEQLVEKVKAAAASKMDRHRLKSASKSSIRSLSSSHYHPQQIILIGASTGGIEALQYILTQLPKQMPGICVVQHIPAYFSKAFADRLNKLCSMEVREAIDGDRVRPGLALVAPGDHHMLLQWQLDHYRIQLKKGPLVHHQRPAIDVLFNTAASCAAKHAVAVLLTGMGKDGSAGMRKLKECGAQTIAQDESSCVVFGMPRAAIELGAVDQVVPLEKIPQTLLECVTPLSLNL